jgi:hypothetical protein
MDVQGDQRPKTIPFLFYKEIRHDPRWAEISLFFIRLFGCWYQSQEKTEVFFDKKNKRLRPCRRAADALLTRRRR